MNVILVLTYARTIANIFLKIYELLIFLRDFVQISRNSREANSIKSYSNCDISLAFAVFLLRLKPKKGDFYPDFFLPFVSRPETINFDSTLCLLLFMVRIHRNQRTVLLSGSMHPFKIVEHAQKQRSRVSRFCAIFSE